MRTKKSIAIKLLLAATLCAAAIPASAERDERHGDSGRHDDHRGGWHGDIRHFDNHDLHTWRGGRWHKGRHEGTFGWWWIAGGAWYFYPQPVYPYPDPYVPPVMVMQATPQIAPAIVTAHPPAPAPAPTPAAPAAAQSWYYCEASKSYYPYVASCPTGWKTVPATPPGK